jgi:hypothetical protein
MQKRLLLTIVLMMFGLAAGTAGAAGGPDDDNDTRQTIVRSRDFTIPAGQCPQLPAGLGLRGTGTEETTIRLRDGDDGPRISVETRISGTATDTDGATYRFAYRNRFSGPFPGTVLVTDTFRLRGDGSADGLFTLFKARITLDAGMNLVAAEILETIGDPLVCDPL